MFRRKAWHAACSLLVACVISLPLPQLPNGFVFLLRLGPKVVPALATQAGAGSAEARSRAAAAPNTVSAAPVQPVPILHSDGKPVPLGTLVLDPNSAGHLVATDNRLTVEVPAGAVTPADVAAAGGQISLRLSQIAPASGSSAGGSGHVSFGTFLLQLVDASGNLASQGLRQTPSVALHYGPRDVAVDLAHAFVVLNGPIPQNTNLNPNPNGTAMTATAAGVGTSSTQATAFDPKQITIGAPTAMNSPSMTVSFFTNSPIATFGKPDPFNVDLNAGSLTARYPLDVPAGPGGFKPPLSLAYSSAGVAEQHNPQGAAGWVGEGWNLTLGSISWAEHNVPLKSAGSNWQDTWQLNDPYGTASELIPPTTTTKISNDDTTNPIANPVQWHTAWESRARVFSYMVPNFTDDPTAVSWGPNRVDLFARGSDGSLWHRWFDTGGWHAWESLAGTIVGSPVAASWGSGHLDVFARGTDGNLWHRGFDTGFGGWQAWDNIGAPSGWIVASDPGAVSWGPNRVDVFVRASDGDIWHRPFASGWGAWDMLGMPSVGWSSAGGPDAASWASSHLDVFGLGSDGAVWHRGYDPSIGGWQSSWDSIGAPSVGLAASSPGAVSWGTSRVDLFARGTDNALWHRLFDTAGWHPWESKGGLIVGGPDASSWASGHLDVFARGSDGSIQHLAYDAGAWWTSWESLSTPTLPCFRAFLPNGMMEEFGCTVDSMQFYAQPNGTNAGQDYIANWLLDLITDPNGNQIHVTYRQDMQPNVAVSRTYPRDDVMSTVEWDSPSCHSTAVACTGTTWTPLMRVMFLASNSVAHVGPSPSTICGPNGSLRCDDPVDLSGSGGLPNPTVQNTFVLNDAQVQVRSSGAGSWNTLRTFRFSYDQGPPATITDPATGTSESTAGRLNLTQFSQLGTDGVTQFPPRTFSYQRLYEYYEDSVYRAAGTNCGPTGPSLCWLWSQSYEGNSYYLATVANGLGLQQTYTWNNAHNNTHGGPANVLDPLGCNGVSTYPCTGSDDESWSHVVLSREDDTANSVVSTTTYSYLLTSYAAKACSDCAQGFYWGNQPDNDAADFYNGKFMGFSQAWVLRPDNSVEKHYYYTTQGWGVYDTSQVPASYCSGIPSCVLDSWWQLNNAAHGHEYKFDFFQDINQIIPLRETTTAYTLTCPAIDPGTGLAFPGSPPSPTYGNWNLNRVSELDPTNPVALCDITVANVHQVREGTSGSGAAPELTTTYLYDNWDRTLTETPVSNGGAAPWYPGDANPPGPPIPAGSPTTIVHSFGYIWNDSVSSTAASAQGTYLINFQSRSSIQDGSGNRYACTYTRYDGMTADSETQTALLTSGNRTEVDQYSSCGTVANGYSDRSGLSATKYAYDAPGSGNLLKTTDPNNNVGVAPAQTCQASQCVAYDTTFNALLTSVSNALTTQNSDQPPARTNYDPAFSSAFGFGLWPMSTTDPNVQTTSYQYDPLGRPSSLILPGDTTSLRTTDVAYNVSCSGTTVCVEIDRTQRLDTSTTVTSRSYYDGWGHLVETRTPGPVGTGQDVVQFSTYDVMGRLASRSVPYFVATATSYSPPDTNQAKTQYVYDPLGRATLITDALGNQTTVSYGSICNVSFLGTADTACYEQTVSVDANQHQKVTFVDAMGRTDYVQLFSGSGPYSVYATTKYAYDYLGNLQAILHPDNSSLTTSVHDAMGRLTKLFDPDFGANLSTRTPATYVYDAVGNVIQSTDARGSAYTVFMGYDALNRPRWHNSTNSITGAYEVWSYDDLTPGKNGVGRLTSETFSEPGTSLAGSYAYAYDGRGRMTSSPLTVNGTPYAVGTSYDDADHVTSQTYPTTETVASTYPGGWLTGVTTTQGNTTLLGNVSYTGQFGGPAGLITGASLGNGVYSYGATYDALLRATNLAWTSGSTTLFSQARTFDGAGNVLTANTTMPVGGGTQTDNQSFCYDAQNRLVWAGSVGPVRIIPPATTPCNSLTPGTLTAAQYSQSFDYDALGRLTASTATGSYSGPVGSISYGDSAHLHAATAIGSSWTGMYDAAGNLTCRAPSISSTCAGTRTGAKLTFGLEGRLASWQNTQSNPTSTAAFLYDNEGNRVAQQATNGTATTTTVYVGGLEQVSTGSTATTTTYYYAGGQRIALFNGAFSYLATDGLGSANVVLNTSGGTTASTLYAPYGGSRYSSGTMPTDYGFTGQHADNGLNGTTANTGLDYYNARYYDPLAGQFTSADSILPGDGYDVFGLSRYAYVEGNPVIRADPSGHSTILCDSPCPRSDSPPPIRIAPGLREDPRTPGTQTLNPGLPACMYGDPPGSCDPQLGHDLGYYNPFGPAAWACMARPACMQGTGDVADFVMLAIPGPDALVLLARAAKVLLRAKKGTEAAIFIVDSSGVARIYVRAGSETLTVSDHAALRMVERGISIETLATTLAKPGFAHFHKGVWKVGFYDPASRVFVGTIKGEVKTVIANASPNYITNLLDATW